MKHLVLAGTLLLAVALVNCGGGSGGDPGGTTPHPLDGTWRGTLSAGVQISFRIDAAGTVSDFQSGGGGGGALLGGTASAGPDVYVLTLQNTTGDLVDCPFLVDPAGRHGTFVLLGVAPTFISLFAAMERGATNAPTYFAPDIWGSWTGFGYAYDQPSLDFVPISPATATAADGTPDDLFTVGLPGSIFDGAFDGGVLSLGIWGGTVNISLAEVIVIMSFDKSYVAVMSRPATVTGTEDYSFFALNRN